MQHLFGIPITNFRFSRLRRYIGQQLGEPAGDGGIQVASATCRTNLSGKSWRSAGSGPP